MRLSSNSVLTVPGSPYTTGTGVDFVSNLGIHTLDFGTFHMYPDEGCESFSSRCTYCTNLYDIANFVSCNKGARQTRGAMDGSLTMQPLARQPTSLVFSKNMALLVTMLVLNLNGRPRLYR